MTQKDRLAVCDFMKEKLVGHALNFYWQMEELGGQIERSAVLITFHDRDNWPLAYVLLTTVPDGFANDVQDSELLGVTKKVSSGSLYETEMQRMFGTKALHGQRNRTTK